MKLVGPCVTEIQGDSGGRLTRLGCSFLYLPNSAWADGILAEWAGQQGKVVEH